MDNERFERIKAKHPDWSDEQVWTAVAIGLEQDKTLDSTPEDLNPNDPIIWSEIIQRAKNWLNEVLPMIFEKVKELFTNLLNKLKEWVAKKIPVIWDVISEFIGRFGTIR